MFEIYSAHYYNENQESDYIRQANKKLLDIFMYEMNRLKDNQFILTADEVGIAELEQGLEIIPNLATEDLAFRRKRLLNRNTTKPPYTMEYLQSKLDELIGIRGYGLEMDYPNYMLGVECSLDDSKLYQEIATTIDKIKPANIINKLTWIRELPKSTVRIGSAITIGSELIIYPMFSDELMGQGKMKLLSYYKQGTNLTVYPKEEVST